MTYEKKTWINDEVIERFEMQNIEDGIDTAHNNIDSHIIDATKHLTSAQNDGLDGANAPGSGNVFATILDIALTIDDTAYNESTWNGDTDAASKNAIRDKIVAIDSDIAVNTTHKTSNGSNHTFIDQDVTNGSSPTIVGTNVTAIPSDNIIFNVLGTPTYETAQDWFNVIQTSGIISGFELSNSRSAIELDVAAGTGIIKTTDSEIGCSASFDFAGVQNVTLTGNNINYIYLDYNVGTPQIVATTDRTSIELNRHFIIGRVYKNGSTLHILNAGVHLPNLARNEHERLVERDGFTYSSGTITSETGTLNLAVTAGVWFLGHNRLTTDALNSSVADTWIYTHYGVASWIEDDATAEAVDTTHYNSGADVITSLGSNNYGAQWVYITSDSHWYVIYGTINGTLSTAQAATPPTSLPPYVTYMGELIAKIIHKQDGTIVSIEITQDVEFTSSGIPNHNDTGSLQGGIANEYYHLTSAEKTLFNTVETDAAADQTASEVPIVDSGSIITATDVEDALQENRTAINLNTAKVTNATHTGEVTGSGALTVDKTAITGKGAVTAVGADYVLISDTGDSGNLKKALVSDFGGGAITAESFSSSPVHLTTDQDAGKAFTIASFPTHAQIKKIRIRADFTAGQQSDTGSALINDGTGIAPADTSIVYDEDSPTDLFAVNDQIKIDSEWMDVTGVDTGTNTLTVTRGIKGTIAAYHDDNAIITKGNHGIRIVLFKDSSKKYSERIIELSSMMTYKGITDAAISENDDYFGLTADIQNLGNGDFLVIEDTAEEVCRVQNVNHDVASATYDYTIFVQDDLTAHDITKDVKKLIIFDLDVPYSSGAGTLYGTVFVDEKIAATVNVKVEIETDSYT